MGSCTNAGNGGTRKGLATELHSVARTFAFGIFLIEAHYLYSMSMMIKSPWEKCFGRGSASSRSIMQRLCTFFPLQKEHEISERRLFWHNTSDGDFGERFQETVCALWYHSGIPCMQFLTKLKASEIYQKAKQAPKKLHLKEIRFLTICTRYSKRKAW